METQHTLAAYLFSPFLVDAHVYLKKLMKTNKLELHWDKNEQRYSEQHKHTQINNNQKRDVEEYFKFLSDIEPDHFIPKKERPVDKQFTLEIIL